LIRKSPKKAELAEDLLDQTLKYAWIFQMATMTTIMQPPEAIREAESHRDGGNKTGTHQIWSGRPV